MLLAAYKPPFISSNNFLSRIKKRLQLPKAGYLGTLDPFAKGVMVIGFGASTRLFPHLCKTPKVYKATLWLGLRSTSLDMENIQSITPTPPQNLTQITQVIQSLVGVIEYQPPHFSARHINGKRAYQLAREGKEFTLPLAHMEIFYAKLLHYCHPFLSFEVSVSEGAYVRSIGEIIAHRLGCDGALSSLERLSEGNMKVESHDVYLHHGIPINGMRQLNALHHLPYAHLKNLDKFYDDFVHGKKITLKNIQKGKYIACFEDFFSIIEVFSDGSIAYIANRIKIC